MAEPDARRARPNGRASQETATGPVRPRGRHGRHCCPGASRVRDCRPAGRRRKPPGLNAADEASDRGDGHVVARTTTRPTHPGAPGTFAAPHDHGKECRPGYPRPLRRRRHRRSRPRAGSRRHPPQPRHAQMEPAPAIHSWPAAATTLQRRLPRRRARTGKLPRDQGRHDKDPVRHQRTMPARRTTMRDPPAAVASHHHRPPVTLIPAATGRRLSATSRRRGSVGARADGLAKD